MPRRLLTAIAVAGLAAAALAAALPDSSRAALKARVRTILVPSDYQQTLPEDEPLMPMPFVVPGIIRGLARIGLVVLVLLGVAGLVLGLTRAKARRARAPDPIEATGPQSLPPEPTEPHVPTLDEADRLAATGAHREAVHLLLVVAAASVARAASVAIPPATTGRELSAILPLAEDHLERFEALVRAVERVLFGGGDADATDYTACRARCVGLLVGE